MHDNITRVIRFITSDGMEHPSLEEAQWHNTMLVACEHLQAWIERKYGDSPNRQLITSGIRAWEVTKARFAMKAAAAGKQDNG